MTNIGVFGMDPGGHTGLAWGIFDPTHPEGVAGALRDRQKAGSTTVVGDERTQIREIADVWQSFYRACVRSAFLPPKKVWFVCEDFILKPGQTSGGRDADSPLGIIWGVEGYRMGREDEFKQGRRGRISERPGMIMQTAGEAKSYATGLRMKEWGVWVVGKEHERSAWAHVATFLKRYMVQHVS